MKKLLAMILCVVMVLSFSATAFAGDEGTTGGIASDYTPDRTPKYNSVGDSKKAIDNLNKDIKAMYYAIVADETVYSSAKGIYDFTDNLAKDLLKDVEKMTFIDRAAGTKTTIYNEDLTSNLRKGINRVIGNEIANYMNDRIEAYTNGNDHIQPDKYLNTYIKALNSVLGSEKAQKNIQSIIYGVVALNTQVSVNDRAQDLYDEIVAWDHIDEFHWADAAGGFANLDPEDFYDITWLPTTDDHGTVFVPTGSATVTSDAGRAYSALQGLLN